MSTIKVPASIVDKIPKEFLSLSDEYSYRLTKVFANRNASMVSTGKAISGTLEIISIKNTGLPGIRVSRAFDYIRTSPIVKVLDNTENTISFETEGGIYKLERLDNE